LAFLWSKTSAFLPTVVHRSSFKSHVRFPNALFSKQSMFTKPKVILERKKNSITLREFEGCQAVSNAVIVCGFPSTTLTPILTAGFLVEQMNLPLIGVLSSPLFPEKCMIENSLPLPSVRIYGSNKLVVIQGEVKMPSSEVTHDLVSLIFDFAERHSCPMIVATEGLPQENYDRSRDSGKIKFVGTSGSANASLLKEGNTPITEGVISGFSGILLSEGMWAKSDIVCLIAPTASLYPDINATVDILKNMSVLLSLPLDTTPLEKKAKKIDSSFAKLVKDEQISRAAPMTMYG